MEILYISTSFPRPEESSTIYTDLAEEIVKKSHKVTVVVSEEKKKNSQSKLVIERGMEVLRVVTGNLYDVNVIEKGMTILMMQYQLRNAVKKHLKNKKFDLILFESPPVTTASVVEWAMKYFNCPSYLMLKDIFPQNALDISILTTKHPAYHYFKYKEKKLYGTASIIGVMSEANREYILSHNPEVSGEKVKIFPNTKKIRESNKTTSTKFRAKYKIPETSMLTVYGGNMGKPQGIDFVCEILKSNIDNSEVFFLLVGRGTEREKISKVIEDYNIKNALILKSLPRVEYEEMLDEADLGLVFLDQRFTIPNFPSRVLSYFEKRLPVLAAIDANTDFGKMLEVSNSGEYVLAGDLEDFNEKLKRFTDKPDLRELMGRNGHRYLVENYNVENSVSLIESHIFSINKNMEAK